MPNVVLAEGEEYHNAPITNIGDNMLLLQTSYGHQVNG